ncbi:MAG: hypothetical protein WD875_05505 [Pirellulales bacterium]
MRRRALAVEPLEARSLLAATGLEGGMDGSAWNVARAGETSAAFHGFAWRFGDIFGGRESNGAPGFSPFSPRFGAMIVSTPSAGGIDFAKAFVLSTPEGGSFHCVVIVCSTSSFGDSASQIAADRLNLDTLAAGHSAYLSSVDSVFDIAYDSSTQIWRLSPSLTLDRKLHDAWAGDRHKDTGMSSMPKGTTMGGDRTDADLGSMHDAGQGMDGAAGNMPGDRMTGDRMTADKMTGDAMRPIGLPPLLPGLGGAIGTVKTDGGDAARGGSGGEIGGFIAFSTASDVMMSSAVANVFAEAAQRAATTVVLGGGISANGQTTQDANSGAAAETLSPGIVRSQTADAPVLPSRSPDAIHRDDTGGGELPTQQPPIEAIGAIGERPATTATGRVATHAHDAFADDRAADAIAEETNADDGRHDATADSTTAAVADAFAWAHQPEGGMIALAVSYLPSEVDLAHRAEEAWIVEDARPRGDGESDEPRFESNVGLYQVFEVATTMPPSVRTAEYPRQAAAASMPMPPWSAAESSETASRTVASHSEASLGVAGWVGPNYAAATASALAFAAGITFRVSRPLSTARRVVDRLRDRARSDRNSSGKKSLGTK